MPTHELQHDWKSVRAQLARVKADALSDCLDHLSDAEEILTADNIDLGGVVPELRSLSAKLRTVKAEYESGAEIR